MYIRVLDRTSWLDITAIVTVTDDGGSSGRLRREFDVLPPGDIRNCMVALAEDGAFLSRLFQYRFSAGRGLKGHSFGNLFLTALTDITGDFPDAVRQSAEVLKIAGRIFPSTAANVSLSAVLDNGKIVRGETRIGRSNRRIETVRTGTARRETAAGNAGGDCECRPDHYRAGVALYQSDSESARERDSESDPRIEGAESVLRQSDVAARGDHRFQRGGSSGSPAEARGAGRSIAPW